MKRCQHKAPFGVACRSISAVGGNDNVDTMYNGSAVVPDIQLKINDDNHGKYIEFGVLIFKNNTV